MTSKNKVIKILEDIEDKFNKLGGHELFYVYKENEKMNPVLVAKGENELETLMNEKVKNKPEKYRDAILLRVNIGFEKNDIGKTKDDITFGGGSFWIMAMVYHVNSKLKVSRQNEHRQQSFWFNDNELTKRKFSIKDLSLVMKGVYKNLVDMSPFKIYNISDLDEIIKQYDKENKKK